MADIEKVIKAIEICIKNGCKDGIPNQLCPYSSEVGCDLNQILADALAMLKEQETEWEHLWDAPDGTFKGRCKKCGFVHFFIEWHDTQYKFCPECGRSVKWE